MDASEAGSGNLEVTVNDAELPASAEHMGGNRYAVFFTPTEAKPHKIDLSFNKEPVPGKLRVQSVGLKVVGFTNFKELKIAKA